MAITINSTPEAYPSMHDDLWFVVTSTNIAQVNFKYVYDVYVNGALVARVKAFPDPTSGKGIFNAANIIRSYWNSYFKPNGAAKTFWSYTGNDIYVGFEIRFGEEYAGTTYTNLTSGNYRGFNFYNPPFRNPSTSYYQPKVSTWITNRDKSALISPTTGESVFAGWLNAAATTTSLTFTVQKYLQGGAADGSPVASGSFSSSTFVLADLSYGAINTALGSSLITASTYSYGVKINYGGTSSPELIVKVGCSPKTTPVTMHFLNQLGGYDSFSFMAVNRQNRSFERKSFERQNWQLNTSTMQNYDAYKRLNEGGSVFSVQQDVSFRLQSDYISQTDYTWLNEMIGSPEVYLEDGGYFYPVAIKTANWDEKIRSADKMFNLQLEVGYGRKLNSQYR
jgi:hypothetical protein